MTTVFLPLWNSFRSGFFEETKQKYNHFNNGRAARNGICFSSCPPSEACFLKYKNYKHEKKEIAHEHVIEKYSFNLQFESFMVSKCVNTATFSLAMTFCHQKKFINRQHLAQITFLPSPSSHSFIGISMFSLSPQMICNAYLQSGEEIACYFKRPSTELTLDWEEAPLTTLKFT